MGAAVFIQMNSCPYPSAAQITDSSWQPVVKVFAKQALSNARRSGRKIARRPKAAARAHSQ